MFLVEGAASLSAVIPVSSLSSAPHLREKTLRIAQLLRSASIFRVKDILFYSDTGKEEEKEVGTIVRYLMLPPYLKKSFPITDATRYVGVAPPIKTPLHTASRDVKAALAEPVRQAVVTHDAALVDAGLGSHLPFYALSAHRRGELVYIRVERHGRELAARELHPSEIRVYTGPSVHFVKASDILTYDRTFTRVELTRQGTFFGDLRTLKGSGYLLFVGDQERDPHEFITENFDLRVNLVRKQGVETVRSEEAFLIALSQFSLCTG